MSQDARVDEEFNTQRRARILGLEYIDTSKLTDKPLYKDVLSFADMSNLRIVPITSSQHNLLFGITNNTSQQTMASLRSKFLDQTVGFAMISDSGFKDYMNLYNPPKKVVYHDIKLGSESTKESVSTISTTLKQVKADDMLAYLVEQAHQLNASDIHIETQIGDQIRIRFRIDGVLHTIANIDIDKYRILIGAIASSGNISTSANEAQQGHIYQHVKMSNGKEVDVNVRLETSPTINGMDVVMRLFNMDKSMFTLDRLSLSKEERSILDEIIKRPSGLVLVVGPTGSGKTTTIYSILNSLSNDERKIVTIEDPVEYQFPGVTQISVTSGNGRESNFADSLRAVLRLDPDVVMVGEIRDIDTARTALQAALTGHLVLATFHAASAAAALTRIIDIIGENPLFLSSIRLVMAQRLLRKLDERNKVKYQPDEKVYDFIKNVVESLPSNIQKPDLSDLSLFKPGSSPESPYGYSGRIAVREQFLMTGEILKLLQNTKITSTEEIEKAAIQSGMRTMLQDGILKVIDGQTSIDEILRVIG